MQNDITYLRDRVDGIAEVLIEQSKQLTRNTVILELNTESLQEHMRRTEALEKQMDVALIPVKGLKWLGILITLLGTAIGAILGISELIK